MNRQCSSNSRSESKTFPGFIAVIGALRPQARVVGQFYKILGERIPMAPLLDLFANLTGGRGPPVFVFVPFPGRLRCEPGMSIVR